jgi:hypothetical protein
MYLLTLLSPMSMPSHDSFWLDDGERRTPISPEAGQTDPQQTISWRQFRAPSRGPPQRTYLVAQSQVLKFEDSARPEDRMQGGEERREKNQHRKKEL